MAIAFDAKSNGTSQTVSHTCTGSNLILVTGFITYRAAGSANSVTGVTYNSVAMTQAGELTRNATSEYQYIYYLVGPATGAHNIVVSTSNTLDAFGMSSASYTGASQTGQPDSYATEGPYGSGSITVTTTTVADNCWLAGFFCIDNGTPPWTAGTNTTLRDATINEVFADSNGVQTPAGSHSLTATHASGSAISAQVISIKPPSTVNSGSSFLAFM